MKFLPSPPVVSAAISGFVVGIVVTLALNGSFATGQKSAVPTATLVPATTVDEAQLIGQLYKIADHQLGPSPDAKHSRLLTLWVSTPRGYPAASTLPVSPGDTVRIGFQLYDNPLGPSWRLRSAKADVFGLLKSLYTSNLPVYNVELTGSFFPKRGSPVVIRRAVETFMPETVAQRIPWKRWGRDHEGQVWDELTFKYVNPRFA